MSIRDELIGKQIGDWYFRGLAQRYNHVICQCSCGTIKEVSAQHLIAFGLVQIPKL